MTATSADTTAVPAEATESPRPPATRRKSWRDVLSALGRPKVGLMLALGFSSGLPFMLIGNTLGFWLSENHIRLSVIGYLSWAGLAYLWKFVWGAIVDRLPAPALRNLGRRRGWMICTQVAVAVGLIGMAASGPHHLAALGAFAVLTGIGAAMQDTVIDAWRIEISDDADELGLLTSAYSLGYRIALFGTEALILLVATWIGWAVAYGLYGAAMAVGMIAAVLAREPERADAAMEARDHAAPGFSLRAAYDAVAGPFLAFLKTHGVGLAALMLGMITLYHLCDYMRGPMSTPFYTALHISKPTIAFVRGGIGVPLTIAGIALGGLSSLRLGNVQTLLIGAVLQPVGIGAFAILGQHGGDFPLLTLGPVQATAFEAIMAFDAFSIGFSGLALIAYMSSLTSLGYTATQYALLTSAMAWSGKILKGFSGDLVELFQHGGHSLLQAYSMFYVACAAIGAPALIACLALVLVERRAQPVRARTS